MKRASVLPIELLATDRKDICASHQFRIHNDALVLRINLEASHLGDLRIGEDTGSEDCRQIREALASSKKKKR
jgi:hypothetical protein